MLAGQSDHSGITVSLAGTGFSTTSNAEGNYTLANIPQGEYDIVFDGPDGSGYETGATLYGYRLFVGIDDYDLTNARLWLGSGILLDETSYYDYYDSYDYNYSLVQISHDSTRVVYTNGDYGDWLANLYSVPIGGGTPTLLAENAYSVQISQDSTRVVYTDGYYSANLYSVPIDGSSAPTLLAENVNFDYVRISRDSTRVVYTSGGYSSTNLYSVPIGGGTPTLLAEGAYIVQISPDSTRVVYIYLSSLGDLYSVPIDGSSAPTLLAENAHDAQISPDSTRVVYRWGNFYSIPIDGGTPTLLVSGAGYGDRLVRISPDLTSVVYEHNFGVSTNYYNGHSSRLMAAPLL